MEVTLYCTIQLPLIKTRLHASGGNSEGDYLLNRDFTLGSTQVEVTLKELENERTQNPRLHASGGNSLVKASIFSLTFLGSTQVEVTLNIHARNEDIHARLHASGGNSEPISIENTSPF